MASFTLSEWRRKAHESLQRFGRVAHRDGPLAVYAGITGMTLWPVVSELIKTGDPGQVLLAFYAVLGGVGGNLAATRLEAWARTTQPTEIAQVSEWVASEAGDPQVRAELDTILQRLDALPAAFRHLDETLREERLAMLRSELGELGNLGRFEDTLSIIVRGDWVEGDKYELSGVFFGPVNIKSTIIEAQPADPLRGTPLENADETDPLARLLALSTSYTPHLTHLIGHERELARAVDLLERVDTGSRGETIFLLGRRGSGRRVFAHELMLQAEDRGFNIITARFEEDEKTQKEQLQLYRRERRPNLIMYVNQTFPKSTKELGGDVWTDVMIQLSETGAFAYVPQFEIHDRPDALLAFVRKSAREVPLLLTIEQLDWAPGIWIDLLRQVSQVIAMGQRVLLLVTLEAPRPLSQLAGDDHSEPTRLAQRLVRQEQAKSLFLGHVSPADISRWIGPAEAGLVQRLDDLAAGDTKALETIWLEWVAQGVVARDDNGAWRVADSEWATWYVYEDVADLACALLAEALSEAGPDSALSAAEAEQVLCCAALEGPVFTIEAVAEVLARDPDDLMDFLDDTLVYYDDRPYSDAEITRALIEDAMPQVNGRSLHQYRFARPYLYYAWRRRGVLQAQRRAWQMKLPLTLEALYYPGADAIAGKLIRLFDEAGLHGLAGDYRNRRLGQYSLEQQIWHVNRLFEDRTLEPFTAFRLYSAAIPLLNRLAGRHPDRWRDGLRIARAVGASQSGLAGCSC